MATLSISHLPRLNIFTNDLEGWVLDYKYYAGACSPQYIGDTNFRKPYNVESYLAEVCIEELYVQLKFLGLLIHQVIY